MSQASRVNLVSAVKEFRRDTLRQFPPAMARAVLKTMYGGKRIAGLARWLLPGAGRMFSAREERRLLMVYDLGSQSLSIGDILCYHEASLVLRERHGVSRVDFALVYDPSRPLGPQNPISSVLDEREFTYQLAPLLPLIQFNPHVGSFFVFDSRSRFERFVADNADSYCVWPSATLYAGREYLLYNILNELLYSYYRERGALPRLCPTQHLVDWAMAFHRQVAYPDLPVSVHLRRNNRFGQDRNSNVEAWLEFFRYCESRYPATFVVIGNSSEVDERLRRCTNVVIAKDRHTSIEHDLALVHTATIHMGADSGPVVMAIFGDKPYLAANTAILSHLHRDMLEEGEFRRFYFAGPVQRYCVGRETSMLLINEFARMWGAVDTTSWWDSKSAVSDVPVVGSWLR